METPIVIAINKQQNYTQSPIAYVDYFANNDLLIATSPNRLLHDQAQYIPSICVVYHNEPARLAHYELKLHEMKHLKGGWNGYAAPVPTDLAVATAKNFISVLLKEQQEPKKVVPSAAGGVGVTQRRNGRKVFVEFFNDGKVFALFSDGSSEPLSKEILPSHHAFKRLTKEMQEYLDA